jgi:hypothetical protein
MMNITPESERYAREKIELELHPSVIRRLKAHAKNLKNSSPSYVANEVLGDSLPKESAGKKAKGKPDEIAKVA